MEKRKQSLDGTAKASFIRKYLPDEKPILGLVIFVILCAGLIIGLSHKPSPKPEVRSVQLAGLKLVNKDKQAAGQELAKSAAAQKITITIKDKTYSYSDKDLGVKRDVSLLLDAVYSPPDSFINNKFIDKKQQAVMNTYVQRGALVKAIDMNLGDNKTAVDASVSINGSTLTVNRGRAGLNIDYNQLINQIERSDLSPHINLKATFTQQQPAIDSPAAEDAKTQALALINPAYGVSTDSYGNKYASLAQKASWLVFTPDAAKHQISVAVNIAAAKNTMVKIAESFEQPAKNQIILTGTDGSTATLDNGQPGLSVAQASINSGLDQLAAAITDDKAFTFPVIVAAQTQGERNLGTSTGGKFVLVDVADYRAYAINNMTVDKTMVVSTGRPGLETPKGHFNIISKTRLITMKGCNKLVGCWSVPNVPNAEFFTSDGDALHGTYWYVNWGHQNLSHGCVNLQLADAAWLYDWTSVGTDVIVA
jgi:lipoprotein-anchoring transpeptidase ErfK/SrfK